MGVAYRSAPRPPSARSPAVPRARICASGVCAMPCVRAGRPVCGCVDACPPPCVAVPECVCGVRAGSKFGAVLDMVTDR